jgi:pilus assembly protein CpaC
LFRSKRFQNNETELVVFVTPTAVDKHTLAQASNMENAVARLEKTPRVGTPDLASVPGIRPPADGSANPSIPNWLDPEN